jgi:hypothetical protein
MMMAAVSESKENYVESLISHSKCLPYRERGETLQVNLEKNG